MIIKRIDPVSYAKFGGALCAIVGLLIGLVVALVGSSLGGTMIGGFGMAAVIIAPILYGIFGFVASLITALIYNLVAGWVGGVRIDVE